MVAAKTDRAHEGLARQFIDHSIDRRYRAIAEGPRGSPRGRSTHRSRAARRTAKIAIVRRQRAVTTSRRCVPLRDAALVECRLETGRTHQVRVHSGVDATPLLGDPTL